MESEGKIIVNRIEIECLCDYTISNLWSIDAEIEIEIPSDGTRIMKQVRLDKYHTSFKIDRITEVRRLNVKNYKYLSFNTTIRINSATGFKIFQADFSTPANIDSTVILNVSGRKLYVDKYALITVSSVFRELLSNSDEIVIKELPFGPFVNFLRLLYRHVMLIECGCKITLYRLAARLDVHFLTADIEEYIISSNKCCNGNKLGIAERNGMPKLQATILDKITFDEVDDSLGSETSEAISRKFVEIGMKSTFKNWHLTKVERFRIFPSHREESYEYQNDDIVNQDLMLEACREVRVPRGKPFRPKEPYLTQKVGNIQWSITPELRRIGAAEYQRVSIKCLYDFEASNLWELDAEIEVEEFKDNVLIFREKMDFCFDRRDRKRELLNECHMRDLSEQEYMVSRFKIRTTVRRKSMIGIRESKRTDFSIPLDIDSAVVFEVEGQKFYVDKYALMAPSPVFREILPNATKIEMKEVNHKNFLHFLRYLHCYEYAITNENVEVLLGLAERYDFECLISSCEDYLISTKGISNETKLRIAENFRFSKLQIKTLNNLTIPEMLRLIKNADHTTGRKTFEGLLKNLYQFLKLLAPRMPELEFAPYFYTEYKWARNKTLKFLVSKI